jgi:hypothetical protein
VFLPCLSCVLLISFVSPQIWMMRPTPYLAFGEGLLCREYWSQRWLRISLAFVWSLTRSSTSTTYRRLATASIHPPLICPYPNQCTSDKRKTSKWLEMAHSPCVGFRNLSTATVMGVETNGQWVVPQGHELRRIDATLLLLQMDGIVIYLPGAAYHTRGLRR